MPWIGERFVLMAALIVALYRQGLHILVALWLAAILRIPLDEHLKLWRVPSLLAQP
jgi:hypothetical protein